MDINKTARPVSRQRAILLDDRDVFAIMAETLNSVANDDGLPYEVVGWRREVAQARRRPPAHLDAGALYQCVERLFNNRVQTIESYLQVNEAAGGAAR